MEDFSNIINWENVFKQSEDFITKVPFKFGFIEDIFQKDFYEKLYETIPKIDENSKISKTATKTCYFRNVGKHDSNDVVVYGDDPTLSPEWNKLKRYLQTEEFIENIRKFSDVPVNKLRNSKFISYKKGGFQLPHIHNVGPSTLVFMFYFSKNWQKGDPGGTYVASKADESTIIFEPYNLDNSVVIFHDGPKAAHGVRCIAKDVERYAFQITLERFDEKTGWTGDSND